LVRCFISFNIDDESFMSGLIKVQKKLKETGADLKLVKPENIHVTLRFLGEIQQEMIKKISDEMDGISFEPFNMELQGVGVFPNIRRINVIWVGIRKGLKQVEEIYDQLEGCLTKLGFKSDGKKFSPHITISRVRTGRNKEDLGHLLKELQDLDFGSFKISTLKLMKSVLTPKGPIYSTLHEVKK